MIFEAVMLVIGFFGLIAGVVVGFNFLSWIPTALIIVFGIIGLFLDLRYDTYVIILANKNGKKPIQILNAKKFYNNKKENEGYYLRIEGIKTPQPLPKDEFNNLNLSHRRFSVYAFLIEGKKLAPCKIKFNVDNVEFISDTLIANHYQLRSICKELTKPPQDNLQMIINVGLILCMIGCIITMIYSAGKLGVNIAGINYVVEKIDDLLNMFSDLFTKIEESGGNFLGLVNNSGISNPPINR